MQLLGLAKVDSPLYEIQYSTPNGIKKIISFLFFSFWVFPGTKQKANSGIESEEDPKTCDEHVTQIFFWVSSGSKLKVNSNLNSEGKPKNL